MEDIPRDVQKEIESYTAPPKSRKTGHWTLLFVGDQGEVITIRKFKGLMLLAVFIMVVALSGTASIYMLYKKPFAENRRLEAKLTQVAGQVRALGEERDLLLTRLGIAESKLKKAQVPPQPVLAEEGAPDAETAQPQDTPESPSVEAAAVESVQTRPAETKPPVRAETASPPPAAEDMKPEVKVDVRDFQVEHDPEQTLLKVQFRLKNVNVEAGAVSGRTFVVLKNDQDAATGVLTFPKVTLVDGKPGRIHLGRYFSISRFNIVKFKTVFTDSPRPFNSATVFVYSGAGDLLLEKQFAIENPFKGTAAPPPAPNGAGTEAAGEPEAGSDLLVPNNTILNN
jgi:hypothetical protein